MIAEFEVQKDGSIKGKVCPWQTVAIPRVVHNPSAIALPQNRQPQQAMEVIPMASACTCHCAAFVPIEIKEEGGELPPGLYVELHCFPGFRARKLILPPEEKGNLK